MKSINFADKLSKFSDHWSPKVIAEMNDYQFKLAKLEGEFVWHNHPDTDEVFIVIEGSMKIELEDGVVELSAGEMYVVPKGVMHKPSAEKECQIMLVEPRGVINTGEADSDLTAENDVWIQNQTLTEFEVVSPGFEPRSAGPEPTMMDRYTKRLADGPKASHSSSKRCLINHVIVQLHRQVQQHLA